jgi:hypothetical protein
MVKNVAGIRPPKRMDKEMLINATDLLSRIANATKCPDDIKAAKQMLERAILFEGNDDE